MGENTAHSLQAMNDNPGNLSRTCFLLTVTQRLDRKFQNLRQRLDKSCGQIFFTVLTETVTYYYSVISNSHCSNVFTGLKNLNESEWSLVCRNWRTVADSATYTYMYVRQQKRFWMPDSSKWPDCGSFLAIWNIFGLSWISLPVLLNNSGKWTQYKLMHLIADTIIWQMCCFGSDAASNLQSN